MGIVRIHPRSEILRFADPEDLESGDSPTYPANGLSLSVQPGVEIDLAKGLALDVGAFWSSYKTGEYSLVPELHGPLNPPLNASGVASTGQEWGVRVGLAWQPFAAAPPEAPRPARSSTRDRKASPPRSP